MRRRPNRSSYDPRALALGAGAMVVALAVAGCSGESEDGERDEPVASSSEAESEPSPSDSEPSQALQDAVDATIELQAFAIDSDLDLEIAGRELAIGVEGRVDYESPIADIELVVSQDGSASVARVLADGESLWVSIEGAQAPSFPDGATWLQGAAARLSGSTSFTPDGVLGALLVLRGAQDVEEAGTDEIDGVEVTRYTSTFAYEDASAAVSGGEAETLRSSFALTGDAAALELQVEAAVGEDGVLREVRVEVVQDDDVPASGGYDLELSDVGGEIAPPERPDESDVASGPDAEALLDQIIT